jgi:predicted CoA-substrate-specific enzyme activase
VKTELHRIFGIDIGAETVKVVVLGQENNKLTILSRQHEEHGKNPYETLLALLHSLKWSSNDAIAATGRLSRELTCLRVPSKVALTRGVRFAHPDHLPGTIVSIGSQGFSVLELRAGGKTAYRENSRCSQGTGNFLSQLVERFGFSVATASEKCANVQQPILLSGRCPVILKTDMTHLANKGEDISAILAGLYDAVCENVQVLIKPGLTPAKVLLTGGVAQAPRVQQNFSSFLQTRGMCLVQTPCESIHYLEALGAALVAMEQAKKISTIDDLIGNRKTDMFERLPALKKALTQVHRILPTPMENPPSGNAILGFDIGSTGSKAIAIDPQTDRPFWESYLDTKGSPVAAAQQLARLFIEETAGKNTLHSIGVTGSGREIVGSLMASCFGGQAIVIMNEIAAHAEGACYYDPKVDTIFEVGGQDAKYTRLEEGHIIDAAMNEACSAGTGSFIAEQGTRFEGVKNVEDMSKIAMNAEYGVSLGQHCSVFMAEVIADAVADKVPQDAIISGLYDAIAQNYLNRVKGNRSVGRRIFCQGMPFKSDALAAAIARQTGKTIIVPPNPGTIGALGIALITSKQATK